ncbi:Xyloglucan galactosyltransferase KATAMARI1-like protein [Dichanthelium oligosanthes]|uniref:Xyloglucan galactosyltransferase KATAMARI1-like protein n=1 Tax=Dichanthelium oligosanthes TaxID=888268 RepID=A0A1E5VYT2_9POAL|nr:Xyloglucan galactosyltransferase KATAMARI1-like protein [Dichanthelium oligosanthes]
MGGRDHSLVAGRTGWNFRRSNNVDPDWGNDLLVMPACRNMSVLVLESATLHGSDYPVPYPTYFHPRSDADVLRWQDRVRGQRRTWLTAFVGAPRPDVPVNIRVWDHVIAQCFCARRPAPAPCWGARAPPGAPSATPRATSRLFQKTVFCRQPPGDTCTRRSAFDSMVAGCIPVYRWHLPEDHHRYSVYIPDADVRQRNVSIEAVLRAIPPATVERMREEVIRLIPRVLYADPRSRLETLKDAEDIAVEGILGTVARIRNGEYVDSGGPVTEDHPNLFSSTETRFRQKQSMQAADH